MIFRGSEIKTQKISAQTHISEKYIYEIIYVEVKFTNNLLKGPKC